MKRAAWALTLGALCALLALLAPSPAQGQTVRVWYSWRDLEQQTLLELLAALERERPGLHVETLSVPFAAYVSKLETDIPHGNGPDVFLGAHDWIGGFVARGLLAPLEGIEESTYDPVAVRAVRFDGRAWAVPLALKCPLLYVNAALTTTPASTAELEALRGRLPANVYPLAYPTQDAYYHMMWAHAAGAGLLDADTGAYLFAGDGAERSVAQVDRWIRARVVPEEADGALAEQLFLSGQAATAVAGAHFASRVGESGIRFAVAPLPAFSETGRALQPFATVESAYVSARASQPALARWLVGRLAARDFSITRALRARQAVATSSAWDAPAVASDPLLRTLREAARRARPMPSHPVLRAAWDPAGRALRKALRGSTSIHAALEEGARRFRDATRPLPSRREPTALLLVLGLLAMGLCAQALRKARDPSFRRELRESVPAYRWVAHAVVVVGLLVVLPLVLGALTSLYAGRDGNLYYVGFYNYWDILRAQGGSLLQSGSFYVVLLVTVLWTVLNVTLHLTLGVALALLLSRPALALKGMYRVLLIIPWAVPSYVTALAWRGMFHRQVGAINALLRLFGVEPVAWFARFSTSFAANLATNVWLGFPFMMVVTLGALTSIPRDLYEAAEVDGATRWQQFWRITVPLLRPMLAPAAAMGAVWTFNSFNVIYLVSGGEPDGQTEILVTEAYRWAFTRQAQYGYAAAYSVLIFGLLLVGTRALDRWLKRED